MRGIKKCPTIITISRNTVFRDAVDRRQLLQKSNLVNHLSLILFAIYINDIICKLSTSGLSCHVTGIYFQVLTYADDLQLISSSCSDLRRMTKICEDEMKQIVT